MTIHSPYNFVPLVAKDDPMRKAGLPVVVCPEWQEQVSHDVPLEESISGWLDLELTAETPLFVRGTDDSARFYRTPEGQFGIPGTSLRGMLRSVLEIATFSRMSWVDGRRYSVRDLQNRDLYTNRMTESTGHKTYRPRAKSGWLVQDEQGGWQILPCEHWRIECNSRKSRPGRVDLESYFRCRFSDRQPDVSRRFEELRQGSPRAEEALWFTGDHSQRPYPHSRGNQLVYKVVHQLFREAGEGRTQGWLVLTGRPGANKHMDFVFGEAREEASPLTLSTAQMEDYRFIHSNDNERHRETPRGNDSRQYWEERVDSGVGGLPGVPVFYLSGSDGSVSSFGLAQMFKLAYDETPTSLYERYLESVDSPLDKADFAQLLFGYVQEQEGRSVKALRGRVAIETAISSNAVEEKQPRRTILGSPKPSYYPVYLRQKIGIGGRVSGTYKSYMNEDAEIAGWKRYQQRVNVKVPSPGQGQDNVAVSFRPLEAGACFQTRIYIHNLHPVELGALLWSLDFGGRQECRHSLGMGRPYGLGGVKLKLTAHQLESSTSLKKQRDSTADFLKGLSPDENELESARNSFVSFMEEWFCGGWASSEQIRELLELATPREDDRASELRYMTISPNEFTGAKKENVGLLHAGDSAEARERLQQRAENMRNCVEKKKASFEEEKKAAAAAAIEIEQERRRAERQKAIARLLELTPQERQREQVEGLSEEELWNKTVAVFEKHEPVPLLTENLVEEGEEALTSDAPEEKEALREVLLGTEQSKQWKQGQTGMGTGPKRLKAVYRILKGVEEKTGTTRFEEPEKGWSPEELEKYLGLVKTDNWSQEEIRSLKESVKKVKARRWKKKKQKRWEACVKKLMTL
jgi:CRISPR-associated protein (TIGR03986 family)